MNNKQKNSLITAVIILAVIAVGAITYGYHEKDVADMAMNGTMMDQDATTTAEGSTTSTVGSHTTSAAKGSYAATPQPTMRMFAYGKVTVPYPVTWTAKLQNNDLILTPPNPSGQTDYITFTANSPTCATGTGATNCTLITDTSAGVADVLKTSSTNQLTLGVFSEIKAEIEISK
jgi:hypothetical protein